MKISCRFFAPLFLAAFSLAGGDLTIQFQTQGKGMFSSASGAQTEYMSSKFMATKDEGTKIDTLVDYAKGITYTINHKKKTIEFLKFEDALAIMEQMGSSSQLPKEVSGFLGKMLGGDANDVSVDNAGKEPVAGRTCTAYKIKVGKLNAELWADPQLTPPVPVADWTRAVRARAAMMSAAGPMGASYKRLFEEMSKIKGVVLKSKMMGIERTATKVTEGPVEASAFALPSGYAMEDTGKKLREDLAKSKG